MANRRNTYTRTATRRRGSKLNPVARRATGSPLRDRSGARAFLSSDDDAVRAYTTEILRELGYGVAEASSGKAALEILENAHQFDLLLADVVMPGDMNGRELEWARTRR
jgi:PleD family two-component response regulator